MYAAHFAAGLALKGQAPKTPAWVLLAGVFLPDFVWVALGLAGVEPSQGPAFFDDWSHSLAMITMYGIVFAALFWREGMRIMFAAWLAVFSHFLLDLPIHPKNIALFPHSVTHLRWGLWNFGQTPYWFGATKYWWTELVVLTPLCLIYAQGARKANFSVNLIVASCILVLGIHLMALLS
jgi:hypothetical protein